MDEANLKNLWDSGVEEIGDIPDLLSDLVRPKTVSLVKTESPVGTGLVFEVPKLGPFHHDQRFLVTDPTAAAVDPMDPSDLVEFELGPSSTNSTYPPGYDRFEKLPDNLAGLWDVEVEEVIEDELDLLFHRPLSVPLPLPRTETPQPPKRVHRFVVVDGDIRIRVTDATNQPPWLPQVLQGDE